VQTRCVKRARPSGKEKKKVGPCSRGENNLYCSDGSTFKNDGRARS
jgi:hypothetical protein